MSVKKVWRNYRFSILLLIAIFSGMIAGLLLQDRTASILKPFGTVFMNMLFTIVVPLVFFTISSSIASMANLKRLGRILKYVFLVFIVTSLIAGIVMLGTLFFIDPAKGVNIMLEVGEETTVSIGTQIVEAITVTDFSALLSRSHMLPLIIFSCFRAVTDVLVGNSISLS